MFQQIVVLPPQGRGLHDFTAQVHRLVALSGIRTGLCHLFVRHTSASLVIQENADPDVQKDLEAYFLRLVPDGDRLFLHTDEGPDDMPAHVRTALTAVSLTIPVMEGHLGLGTWQAVYLWEHRQRAGRREVVITIQGD